MIDKKYIVLASVPKSGSSMVAGIFANHGVYFGKCEHRTMGGNTYYSYENAVITDYFRNKKRGDLKTLLEQEAKITPFCFKTSPTNAKAFLNEVDALVIKIKRKPQNIIKSSAPHKAPMRKQQILELDSMPGEYIDADAIMNGDYKTVKSALEKIGYEFSEELAKKAIDFKKWHHS